VSFVRSRADVEGARAAVRRLGRAAPIIAKIEKPEALDDLEGILAASDGVMVARGDLGVEMSPEKVPLAQKAIITRAREFMLPVITATQMLESMTRNPRPTRAEASDVANAVLDGTGALMLSEETATGRFPVESVQMMRRIICEAEASPAPLAAIKRTGPKSVAQAISEAVCSAAGEVSLRCIAVFTESGTTARLISQYRPPCPIVGFSTVQGTRRRLGLIWGVLPRRIGRVRSIHDLARTAERRLLEEGLARVGDLVGIFQSGAYARAASPLNFLSHPAPPEVLADAGEDRLIRARGEYSDYLLDQQPSPVPR
ncbi:MAG: pyruvate kinase, partial [Elusimicrobiota bacterium]